VCSRNLRRNSPLVHGGIDPSGGHTERRWWSGDLFIEEENRRLKIVEKKREVPRIVGFGRSEKVSLRVQEEPFGITYRQIGVGECNNPMHVEIAKCDSPI
jgi:hypothetical protein